MRTSTRLALVEWRDRSRNNLLLALPTLGEGWHDNHHHSMGSARQGFLWWEIDVSYYVIKLLERLGLVWDVREPSAKALRPTTRDAAASARALEAPIVTPPLPIATTSS